MRRPGWLACAVAASLAAATVFAQQPPQQPAKQQPAAVKTHLKVGDAAPDFALKDNNGKTVKLKSYRGKKNVVLAFYVIAFTGG
jgi:cytochrome oxidase Cu insertion factor (SCO1/SenC/PrrC family)